ncbi:MAG: hypothetical protein JXB50_06125 [Spirochaetes bacterium]|nr:hypothetical protein [Spirochaetota bacterium]
MNFLKGIKEGFKDFGHLINNIINTVLLTVLYIIGVGPTFLFLKLFKKSILNIKKKTNVKSYWVDYNLKTEPEENYYRQF